MLASHIVRTGFVLCLALLSLTVLATSFDVFYAKVSQRGNAFVLNAEIKYPLTPRVIEALDNGVAITFSQQIELTQSTPILGQYWQWDSLLWAVDLRYELRYHALSQQYIVQVLDTDTQRNFPTRASALFALGSIKELSLPPAYLSDIQHKTVRIRSEIDLYALPTPMRPGALISNKWQLTSPWVNAQWD